MDTLLNNKLGSSKNNLPAYKSTKRGFITQEKYENRISQLTSLIYLANLSGAKVSVTITRDNTVFITAPDDIIAVHSGTASYESQLERAIERIQLLAPSTELLSASLPDPVVPALFSGAK